MTSLMGQQLDALLFNESNDVANLSNAAALLMQSWDKISWAGFYLYNDSNDELVLGPFQGKVACMHIKNGNGVCGTALQTGQVQRIANVHDFPGHIACDSESNAEIVVPLITANGQKIGVLDIDSTNYDRFSAKDEQELKEFATVLMTHLDVAS
ncbi:GAF domain-containing protein [Paucilactobacillus vaccinostercus DSM 20634]|uniref:GAF domain-containing protein n=1 Tax=Paucilactobacillus vaccinostercus DSM 20634 TaxID=1423813 RepID=A0A0R2A940_9LACO|nr:GAF domain-containing protein [Paucilactobacillus vaccinostercus]KRM60587.1 GAF domain-containing protein [Paucilactobacillus vaccinostercus DSM 20634]